MPCIRVANVKGSAITARIRFVRERFGEAELRRLKDSLSETSRGLLDGRVLPHAWVPFDLFVELNLAVDRTFGTGDLSMCREMGRYSAAVNLPTLYRIFYRLGSPSFILRKAAKVWRVHYDSGELRVLDPDLDGPEERATLEIAAFETPHRAHCQSVLGWAERSVELSGGTVIHAREETCRTEGHDTCRLAVRWRA